MSWKPYASLSVFYFPQDEEEDERRRDEGKNGRIEPVGRADSISLE